MASPDMPCQLQQHQCSQHEQCTAVNRITPLGSSGSIGRSFSDSSGGSSSQGQSQSHCMVGAPSYAQVNRSHGSLLDADESVNQQGCEYQPNMKRQRVKSPAGPSEVSDIHNGNSKQPGERTHVMPMFLCIPMLLLALSTQPGSVAAVTGGGKVYRPNRSAAPSRPSGAVDIDYGGVHPFDVHRHLYDVGFSEKKKNGLRFFKSKQQHEQIPRRLKKEEDDKDKNKEKDKEEDKDKEEEKQDEEDKKNEEEKEQVQWVQEKQTEETTKTPTPKPAPQPVEPVESQIDAGQSSTNDVLTFEPPPSDNDSPSLTFEGVDSSSLNIAAANTEGSSQTAEETSSNNHQTTTLDPTNDHLYQPLRIQFDTRQLAQQMNIALSAGDTTAATKLYLLIYEILPMTAQVWGDILRVIPVTGGIYPLAAQGSGVDQLLPSGKNNEQDATTSGEEGGYYDDPIRMMYCPDETTSGIEGGADLLIYSTVNRHCATNAGSGGSGTDARKNVESMGTLASALSCQRDQYDRPITGSIDFCLEGMRGIATMDVASLIAKRESDGIDSSREHMVGSEGASMVWDGWGRKGTNTAAARNEQGGGLGVLESNRAVIQYSVGVAVHEIGHVLGVTSDSLAYFRHPLTGHPLTRRPFEVSTVTCVDGVSTPYVGMPGPAVLQEGRHEGSGSRYFEIVTPTVQRVVRNHFNCQSMKGAKLENQPTSSDCFGSHFDEMLYYTEIMGAVFSQSVNILSPLTLALLEDSGWYRSNYQSDYIQISMFGHSAGCEFVENNCIDSNGNVPPEFEEHFCNNPISISSNGLIDVKASGPQTCDPSHTQKTYCDLVNTNEVVAIGKTGTVLEPAPPKFQYFSPNYRPYIFTNADYCPVPHLDPQSCIEYNGRAQISSEQLEAGEYYGTDSRCIETDGSRSYSLCLQTGCNRNLGKVQITAGGQRRTCEYDGQVHEILYNYDSNGALRIKCPKAALVCPELFCPANCAGRGECVYATDREDDDDLFYDNEAQARCVCDSEDDPTNGCYESNLTFPAVYGYAYANENRADKTLFMIIVGSLVAGLAVIFVAVRQWKARQNVFM